MCAIIFMLAGIATHKLIKIIIIIVLYLDLFCISVWHAHDKIQAICFDICELPSQTNALSSYTLVLRWLIQQVEG